LTILSRERFPADRADLRRRLARDSHFACRSFAQEGFACGSLEQEGCINGILSSWLCVNLRDLRETIPRDLRETIRLHEHDIPHRICPEFLSENLQNLAFVKLKVMLHRRGLEFDKDHFIPDKDFLGALGNGLPHQPFPGSDQISLVKFRFDVKFAQQLLYGLPNVLKFRI
jgi:hypothetical protein